LLRIKHPDEYEKYCNKQTEIEITDCVATAFEVYERVYDQKDQNGIIRIEAIISVCQVLGISDIIDVIDKIKIIQSELKNGRRRNQVQNRNRR
jgi:hypothetical protein